MAEITTLASFDFDTDRIEKGIEDLQKQLFELTKRQQELNAQSKETNKALDAQTKESEKLVQSFKNESQEYQNIIQQQAKLRKSGQENTKQYRDLNQEKSRLIATFKQENSEYQQVNQSITQLQNRQQGLFLSTKDLQIQRDVLNKEYRTATTLKKAMMTGDGQLLTVQEKLNQALNKEVTTRAEAKEQSTQLNRIKDQLNVTNEEELALLTRINERIDANNKLLKETGSERERQVSNVGNYTNSIREAADGMDIFNGGLSGFIQRSQEAGGASNFVANSIKSVTAGFAGLTKASLAFIATPIGAVLAVIAGAFLLVQNALNRSEESTNKLKTAIAPLTGIFQAVLKVLEPLGEFIIDGIVLGFEKATEAIQTTINLVGGALSMLGFDSASQSVLEFSASLDSAMEGAKELALAEQELEKAQRKSRLTQLEYQKEAEKFRQIRDDESLSIQERIKANEQLGEVLNAQLQEELRLAKVALEVANLRIQQEGRTKEALDAQYEALTQIADIEERINGQRSEQLRNINTLRREAQAQQKAAHDERMRQIDAEIAKQREQLELWIAQQGDRARTLEEQLDLQEQTAEKSIAILDKELANKKISQEKYDLEIIKLRQENARIQAEIAVQLAQDELDAFLNNNQSILNNNQLLTSELLDQELERNKAIQEQRNEFERQRFEQGLINQREYNQALLANEREYLAQEKELKQQYAEDLRESERVRRTLEFDAQMIELQENLANEFEIRRKQAEFEYEDRLIELEMQRADGLISEENYQLALDNLIASHAQVRKQIEDDVQTAKLNIYKDTFSGISALVGEQTAMGKTAGIATATINTYQGISEVWKSPSVLPEPANTIMKVAQSAVTLGSGLQTVKKIAGVKTPSVKGYATGGLVTDGFPIKRSNGDNVLATLRTGEVVLNERQQMALGGDAVFKAIGVPGFANGGVVGVPASSLATIQQNLFSNFDITQISEAVREGARDGSATGSAVGSRTGIEQLSNNRNVLNNSYLS